MQAAFVTANAARRAGRAARRSAARFAPRRNAPAHAPVHPARTDCGGAASAAIPPIVGTHVIVNGEPSRGRRRLAPAGSVLPFEFGSAQPRARSCRRSTLDRAAPRNRAAATTCRRSRGCARASSVRGRSAEMAGVVAALQREYPRTSTTRATSGSRSRRCARTSSAPSRPVLLILLGGGRPRAADRLRERREPAARARRSAAPRAGRAHGARRQPVPPRPPAADRVVAALALAGAAAGLLVARRVPARGRGRVAPGALPRVDETRARRPGARVHGGARRRSRCSSSASLPALQMSADSVAPMLEGRRARAPTDGARSARGARRRAGGDRGRAARRRRACSSRASSGCMPVPSGFDTRSRADAAARRCPRRAIPAATEVDRLLRPAARSARARSPAWSPPGRGERPAARGRLGRLELRRRRARRSWHASTPAPRTGSPSRRATSRRCGIRLVRGRLPSDSDARRAPPVLFLNETTARTLFPGEDPIGKRLRFSSTRGSSSPGARSPGSSATSVTAGSIAPPRPEMFFPHAQFQHFSPARRRARMSVVVRTDATARAPLAAAVRARSAPARSRGPARARPRHGGVVASSVADRRLNVMLIGAFGGLALLAGGGRALRRDGVSTCRSGRARSACASRSARAGASAPARRRAGTADRRGGAGRRRRRSPGSSAGSLARLLFDVGPRDLSIFAARRPSFCSPERPRATCPPAARCEWIPSSRSAPRRKGSGLGTRETRDDQRPET